MRAHGLHFKFHANSPSFVAKSARSARSARSAQSARSARPKRSANSPGTSLCFNCSMRKNGRLKIGDDGRRKPAAANGLNIASERLVSPRSDEGGSRNGSPLLHFCLRFATVNRSLPGNRLRQVWGTLSSAFSTPASGGVPAKCAIANFAAWNLVLLWSLDSWTLGASRMWYSPRSRRQMGHLVFYGRPRLAGNFHSLYPFGWGYLLRLFLTGLHT